MDAFAANIKKKYRHRLINREKQWPPCQSKRFIRLELVEKKKTYYPVDKQILDKRENKNVKRTPLAYDDLFNVESGVSSIRRILVSGSAGIGKTTLCTSVSEDWANGKLFQQFELLLLLPLRHKKVSSAGSLCELLKLLHPRKSVCESVVSYLEEEEGEKVLIIADGWDELSESDRQEGSFLYDLLTTEFPLASVIITSRPIASAPLHDFMDRFVDVLGFNKDNIEEFIRSEFASEHEKSDSLIMELESNPLVDSVCSVPLNCAIVCHLWRALGEALPTTMTELYTKIILNFSLRNLRKVDLYKDLKILANFNSFPNELQQSWLLLCKFAFQALLKNQIVFSEEELIDPFPNEFDKIFIFGLLQSSESILETGCGVSFHFLHLTFQEYLAALHLVKEPNAIDHSFKLEADPSTRRLIFYTTSCEFNMMWRFYFGIHFQDSKSSLGEQFAVEHLSHILEISDDGLSILHYAFEAENKMIAHEAIEFVVGHIDDKGGDYINTTFDGLTTAHDCSAVIYAIANIQRSGVININFSNCSIRENQVTMLADALASKHGSLQVKELYLANNSLSDKLSIIQLFEGASAAFQSLEVLNLSHNMIGARCIKQIATTVARSPSNIFSHLDLSHNPLGVPGVQALVKVLCADKLVSLTELNLEGSLTSDDDTNVELLSGLVNALTHCPNFSKLNVSRNNFGTHEKSAIVMISFVQKNGKLCIPDLDLSHNQMKDKHVSILFQRASTVLQSLVSLNLSDNMIGVESINATVRTLAKSPSNNSLLRLDLSQNPLGAAGLQALEEALCCHLWVNLRYLNLKRSLTSDADINGALLTSFLEILADNCPNLEYFNVSRNNLGLPGALALARFISQFNYVLQPIFPWFVKLSLQETMLGSDGLSVFISLAERVSLEIAHLKLHSNPLGLNGVLAIGKLLSSNCCHIDVLNLSKCQLTTPIASLPQQDVADSNIMSEIIKVRNVEKKLHRMSQNHTITRLYLKENDFSSERIFILSGLMYLCPSLAYLDTSNCRLKSDDLKMLLTQLSNLKTSSAHADVCSRLHTWILDGNEIDDTGVSAVIDVIPSLFPNLSVPSSIPSDIVIRKAMVEGRKCKQVN